jgi:DNA-binding transcriptional LysR family regulator
MVALVSQLSLRLDKPVPALLNHFGKYLFQRFTVIHPQYVVSHSSAFDLLQMLDDHVHVEVRKLYKDAELPSFTHERLDEDRMVFVYRSRRALADFAHGLIEGCIAHFGQAMGIERVDLPADEGAHTRFTLTHIRHGRT